MIAQEPSRPAIKHSFAHKLRRMVMLVSGLVLLVTALAYSAYNAIGYYNDLSLRLSSMATIVGINSSAALSFDDPATAEKLLFALKTEKDIRYAILFDKRGKPFAKYARSGLPGLDTFSLDDYMAQGGTGISKKVSPDHMSITSDIVFDETTLGYIQISSSLESLYKSIASMLLLTLGLMLPGFAVVYWLAGKLQLQFSRPVNALVAGMQKVSQTENYDQKLQMTSQDEFGLLTDGFNDMLVQLKKRDVALKGYHAELEQKVGERTEELQKRTEELQKRTEELQSKSDEAQQLATKAEQANHAKSRFLANMSHEIRTPLNGIIGLQRRLSKLNMPPEALDYLNSAQHASNDLLALLNDVLDFSKIEADSLQLESASIHMESFIQNSLISFAQMVEERGISLTVELQGAPTKFISDPLRLRQILLNLTGNAVKFTQHGGVTVSIQQDGVPGLGEGDWIHVCVTDTGKGMSSEQLERIFNAFTQGDESTTRKYGGSGLGLNIAKRLIEIMGGELHVSSEPGKGSSFSFSLPVGIHPDAVMINRIYNISDVHIEPAYEGQSNILFDGQTVLLAEDNEINQLIAKEEMEDMGLKVLVVDNGREAVERWRQGGLDLILMDVYMPEMDGLEATRRIREAEQGSGQAIPIVALTASAMKEDFQRCLSSGMNDYLTKPFQPYELASKLESFIFKDTARATGVQVKLESRQEEARAQPPQVNVANIPGSEKAPLLPLLDQSLIDETLLKRTPKSALKAMQCLRDDMKRELDRLDQAVQAGDWLEFALISHKMIGSCMYIRSEALPMLLRSMQKSGEAGDAQACMEKLETIRPYILKISDEAGKYLSAAEL